MNTSKNKPSSLDAVVVWEVSLLLKVSVYFLCYFMWVYFKWD